MVALLKETNRSSSFKLPPKLAAFEERRQAELEVITYLLAHPEKWPHLPASGLTPGHFIHSTSASKKQIPSLTSSGERIVREVDILIDHATLVEAILLASKTGDQNRSVTVVIQMLDQIYAGKMATAMSKQQRDSLQERWEWARILIGRLHISPPCSVDAFKSHLIYLNNADPSKQISFSFLEARNGNGLSSSQARKTEERTPQQETIYHPFAPEAPQYSTPEQQDNEGHYWPWQPQTPASQELFYYHREDCKDNQTQPGANSQNGESSSRASSYSDQKILEYVYDSEGLAQPELAAALQAPDCLPVQEQVEYPAQSELAAAPGDADYLPIPEPIPEEVARNRQEQVFDQEDSSHRLFKSTHPAPSSYSLDWNRDLDGAAASQRKMESPYLADSISGASEQAPVQPVIQRPQATTAHNPYSNGNRSVYERRPKKKTDSSVAAILPESPITAPSSMSAQQVNDDPLEAIQPLSAYTDDWQEQLFKPRHLTVSMPSLIMDEAFSGGWRTGNFYVVASPPDSSKSNFCSWCADYGAQMKVPTILVTFDSTRQHLWLYGLSRTAMVDSRIIESRRWLVADGDQVREVRDRIKAAAQNYSQVARYLTVIEAHPRLTVSLLEQAVDRVRKYYNAEKPNPVFIVIDGAQLLKTGITEIDSYSDEALKMRMLSSQLKQLARENDAAILAAASFDNLAWDMTINTVDSAPAAQLLRKEFFPAADVIAALACDATDEDDQLQLLMNYYRHNAALLRKLSQLRRDFAACRQGAGRSVYARLTMLKNLVGPRAEMLFLYERAYHNFLALDLLLKLSE